MSEKFYTGPFFTPSQFYTRATEGEEKSYSVDFTAWQESEGTVTSVDWELENGTAIISGEALASGVSSANVSLPSTGTQIITVTAHTATQTKKVVLVIDVQDVEYDISEPEDAYE